MSEQNNKSAITPKCVDCANRMKITHFGEKETFSFVCSIMPLTPMISIENVGIIPNVKECSKYNNIIITLDQLVDYNAKMDDHILQISLIDAEQLLNDFSQYKIEITDPC